LSALDVERTGNGTRRFQERLDILADLVASAQAVCGVDVTIEACDLPPSAVEIGLAGLGSWWGDEGEAPARPFSRIEAGDLPAVITLLGRARSEGYGHGYVRFGGTDGEVAALHIVNMIDEWGVYVLVRGGHSERVALLGGEPRVDAPHQLVLHRDATATIVWADQASEAVLGWTADELVGRQDFDLLHDDDLERAAETWLAMVAGLSTSDPVVVRYRTRSGIYRWFEVRNTNRLDEPDFRSVETELLAVDDQAPPPTRRGPSRAEHEAHLDQLTGLPDRQALRDWLEEKQGADGLVVFFVDLDAFKLVNDGLGHQAGDELLAAAGRAIRGSVRPADFVARLGSDEFVVGCLGVTNQTDAQAVAGRILDAVSSPVVIDGNTLSPTCSIGIAGAGVGADRGGKDGSLDIDRLIGDADIAMSEAKQAGGRRCVVFEQEHRQGVQQQAQIANDLRLALGDGQLQLYLQPIVDMATEQRVGAEALIRWNHPDLGLVSPQLFIPVAERTRMIESLGAWIIDDACRLGAKMAARRSSDRIAINISPRQLAADGFLDLMVAAMDRHELDPTNVVLEVTETVFLETDADVLGTLDSLVDRGVRIALDDFGTGYSSLNHLRQMPTQIVKIDRSYTTDVGIDTRTTAIIDAVVGLAESLGQELVAEGVETRHQAAIMRELGIGLGQGYLLGRPMPEAEFFATATQGP
jgi:diguanylate cyclase (GGDEF)-like protein/PAS domain S-box-containing protein